MQELVRVLASAMGTSVNVKRIVNTGGTLHVIASILAGGETPSNQLTSPEHSFKRIQQQAKAHSTVIEQWAKTV